MTEQTTGAGNRFTLAALAILLLLVGAAAGWFWQARSSEPAKLATADRAAVEAVVREYILNHPEILPQAMQNLQLRENEKLLEGVRAQVETPFPGAILGNPDGKVTLVEFTDFACGYCRQSVPEVEALIAANPDLRVVVRELPIIAPTSEDAARWALAAALQGRYAEFHRAMFAAGRPDAASIEAAAKVAGLDMDKARKAISDPKINDEIASNLEMARKLGLSGTPSWVVGTHLLFGAVGQEELGKAIAEARKQST
jgi:protein-disulfide isomerase